MTYEYLQRLFKPSVGYAGSTRIASELKKHGIVVTKQAVSNWKSRGIPKGVQAQVRAIKAAR